MPEFILDHGTNAAATKFRTLDEFTQGYIEAMFFTNASSPDDGDLATATVADLAAETWGTIEKECAAFQSQNATLLAEAYTRDDYSPEQAGRDFWFTRNGHGVGFWDRPQLDAGNLGDRLSAACRGREVDVYAGDDGRVYLL